MRKLIHSSIHLLFVHVCIHLFISLKFFLLRGLFIFFKVLIHLCLGLPIVNEGRRGLPDTDPYRDIKIKYICQGDSMYLSCTASKVLNIIWARYGREKKDKNKICIGRRMDYVNTAEYCAPDDREDFVKGCCEGRTKCNFTVDTSTMGDKCPGMSVHKDLDVMYGCGK